MGEVFDFMDEWGPEKVLVVYDIRTKMKGMVVIDNTARGMGKGGCRMAPDVTLWDCFRLARTMTWKWALANIFLGGAKSAIVAERKKCERCGRLRPPGYPRFCRECSQYRSNHWYRTLSPEEKAEHNKRCLAWRKVNPERWKEIQSRAQEKYRAKVQRIADDRTQGQEGALYQG